MYAKIKIFFEPRDIWVGLYWKRIEYSGGNIWDLYICLIPMLPINIYLAPKSLGEAGYTILQEIKRERRECR